MKVVVERRDSREVVGSVAITPRTPYALELEGVRAARFGAWRFGVTCWAKDGGRVLSVAHAIDADFPRALRVNNRDGQPDREVCCWPGCPASGWLATGRYRHVRDHVKEAHYLCGCGRFFTADGWAKHRGQYRRADRPTFHPEPLLRMRLRRVSRTRAPC